MTSAGYNSYGQPPYPPGPFGAPPPPPSPRRRGISPLVWVLIVFVALVVLGCAGFLGFAAYVGSVGPDTKVYAGNEVPKRFIDVVNELKLLDPGEQVKFFYSDALTDIREGMYFVTDRKVVVYKADAATPATVVPFNKIADADLQSGSSWIDDGAITLHLTDGSIVVFPVSAEDKRDKLMFDAIRVAPTKKAVETAVEK